MSLTSPERAILYVDRTEESRIAEDLLEKNGIQFSIVVISKRGDYPRPYLAGPDHDMYYGLPQIRRFVNLFRLSENMVNP